MTHQQRTRTARLLLGTCSLAAVLCANATHALNPPVVSDKVTQLRFGFYCDPGTLFEEEAPDTFTGTIGVPERKPDFFSLGATGPATIGMGFGITVEIEPELEGYATILVDHPPHGEEGITQESWESYFSVGSTNFSGFTFEFEYELTPGLWTFSAINADEIIYRVEFDVLPHGMGPQPNGGCRGLVPIA